MSKLDTVPATGLTGVENCIIVNDGADVPEAAEIVNAATGNQAHVDNSADEAGDDLYAVQFPGRIQELLSDDQIATRVRQLLDRK